ncbi:uncharacterized protein LOC117898902 [Drosophila subobscura]|uniref:uncharacterized protein LOC117898902 n=1 Tax=Drosophila subobscura TaxID=7241 RepID=UPI00155AB89A|nr:uncharacterized protein LOC117898902 [Drosophila subobscura]
MRRAQFFLVFLALTAASLAQVQKKTQLNSIVERVFVRKSRAVLFPPGSFLKFTCNLGTGLLATYPRGVSFALEEAVYFPVPGSVNDLYPKRYLPKTTTKKPEKLPDSYVFIPDWRFKAQTLPKPKWRPPPPKTHRIDDGSYANPAKWQQWSEYAKQQEQKWQKPYWKESKWMTPAPKWNHNTAAAKWEKKQWFQGTPATKWRDPPSRTWQSHHYHGHRDRRDLFERFNQLSSLFKMDLKSCILRTICDSKRLLLPPGYSMLQDMLRVVFTMPRLDGVEDEYSRLMDQDAEGCAADLKTKCNMNLLIWLLSGRKE